MWVPKANLKFLFLKQATFPRINAITDENKAGAQFRWGYPPRRGGLRPAGMEWNLNCWCRGGANLKFNCWCRNRANLKNGCLAAPVFFLFLYRINIYIYTFVYVYFICHRHSRSIKLDPGLPPPYPGGATDFE